MNQPRSGSIGAPGAAAARRRRRAATTGAEFQPTSSRRRILREACVGEVRRNGSLGDGGNRDAGHADEGRNKVGGRQWMMETVFLKRKSSLFEGGRFNKNIFFQPLNLRQKFPSLPLSPFITWLQATYFLYLVKIIEIL